MKSQHRHELETNALAKRLDVFVERVGPYTNTILGIIMGVAVLALAWRFMSGASAAKDREAWDRYELAVGTPLVNRPAAEKSLSELIQSAEEYPQSTMQQFAMITWADGQVWTATWDILVNRATALASLDRAASAYLTLINTSQEPQIISRARFGLARIYEMRNEPDKAREQYLLVEGGFQPLAKARADNLDEARTKETLAWLAQAELVPRTTAPAGGGAAGERPLFNPGDLSLPGTSDATEPGDLNISLEEMLRSLRPDLGGTPADTPDRYGEGGTPAGEGEKPAGEGATPAGTAPGGAGGGTPTGSTPTGGGEPGVGGTPAGGGETGGATPAGETPAGTTPSGSAPTGGGEAPAGAAPGGGAGEPAADRVDQ
jgi:hypothetical protein